MNYDRKYFEERTGTYAGYTFEQVYPYMRTMAECLVKSHNPKRVLDVGCAKGFLVEAFQDIGVDAIGVDISKYVARKRATDQLVLMDATNIGFKPETFDLIVSLELIEHLDNPETFIHETERILKPRGHLFITTPTLMGHKKDYDPTHKSVLPEKEWMNLFEGYTRLYDNEIEVRRAVAELYAKNSPSSLIGDVLNQVGLRQKAILLNELLIRPRYQYFFSFRKENENKAKHM